MKCFFKEPVSVKCPLPSYQLAHVTKFPRELEGSVPTCGIYWTKSGSLVAHSGKMIWLSSRLCNPTSFSLNHVKQYLNRVARGLKSLECLLRSIHSGADQTSWCCSLLLIGESLYLLKLTMKSARWTTIWAVILVIFFSFYEVSLSLVQSPRLDNMALWIQYLFKFVLILTYIHCILCILMVSDIADLNVLYTRRNSTPFAETFLNS